MSHRPDRPIADPADDRLGRDGFVARLARALVREEAVDGRTIARASGVVVGLTGPWGSGKSSLLNLLETEIKQQHAAVGAVVVRFDPWLVSGRDDIITQFFAELQATINAVGTSDGQTGGRLQDLGAKLAGYAKDLAPAAALFSMVPGAGTAAAGAAKVAETLLTRDRSLAAQHRELAGMLAGVDVPIVVLIDELDRVEDAEVRAVAQLVRAVADFPGISYLLAYDRPRVVEALGDGNAERGSAYLEKIVQLEIPLPVSVNSEIRGLFTAEVEGAAPAGTLPANWQSDPRWPRFRNIVADGLLTTPRDSRRVCGMYAVLAPMVNREVDWLGLLGYCVLLAKAPAAVEAIRRQPRLVVRDAPVDREDVIDWNAFAKDERAGPADRLARLGVQPDTPLAHLLELLFPLLRSGSWAEDGEPVDGLRRYRPLMTVLRLGLLPGAVGRSEIDNFLAGDDEARWSQLRVCHTDQSLTPFLDRLADLYRDIGDPDPERTLRILGSVPRDIKAAGSECSGESYDLCRGFSRFLNQAVERCGVSAALGERVLTALMEAGHLDAVAMVLREQGFQRGPLGHERRSAGDAWLPPECFEHLAGDLVGIVETRWRDGRLLADVGTPEPLFLAEHLDRWDADCREGLSERVRTDDGALRAVTRLFFGHGIISFADLNLFLDATLFLERLAAVADTDGEWDEHARTARARALHWLARR